MHYIINVKSSSTISTCYKVRFDRVAGMPIILVSDRYGFNVHAFSTMQEYVRYVTGGNGSIDIIKSDVAKSYSDLVDRLMLLVELSL